MRIGVWGSPPKHNAQILPAPQPPSLHPRFTTCPRASQPRTRLFLGAERALGHMHKQVSRAALGSSTGSLPPCRCRRGWAREAGYLQASKHFIVIQDERSWQNGAAAASNYHGRPNYGAALKPAGACKTCSGAPLPAVQAQEGSRALLDPHPALGTPKCVGTVGKGWSEPEPRGAGSRKQWVLGLERTERASQLLGSGK